MEIIDAQIHRHPCAGSGDTNGTTASAADIDVELAVAAMDAVGVDAAVVHWEDDGFCEAASSRYPDRFAGIIQLPGIGASYAKFQEIPPNAEAVVEGLRGRPGVLGFRIVLGWPASGERLHLLREGHLESWFAAAEKYNVPICIFLSGHLEEAGRIADRYPGLSIIIDHLGMMPVPLVPVTSDLFASLPDLLDLARFENIAVKLTGVAALSMEAYPFADLWGSLHQVIAAFGVERLMWGSDYTRTKSVCTYAELLNLILHTNEVSQADKVMLLGGSIRQWLRWPKDS